MNRGFSLIEVVITLVVLAIVGIFTFSFLGKNIQTYRLMEDQRTAHQEAATVLERITRELRDAAASPTFSGGTLSFQGAHGTGADSNTYVSFCLNSGSGQLFRCSGAGSLCANCTGSGILLATGISSFSVTQQTYGGVVEGWVVSLTASAGGQTQSYGVLVDPKNQPFLGCAGTQPEFCGRNFGGYYEDKIY